MGHSSQSSFLLSPTISSPYMYVSSPPSLLTQSDHAKFGTLFRVVFEPFSCLMYKAVPSNKDFKSLDSRGMPHDSCLSSVLPYSVQFTQ